MHYNNGNQHECHWGPYDVTRQDKYTRSASLLQNSGQQIHMTHHMDVRVLTSHQTHACVDRLSKIATHERQQSWHGWKRHSMNLRWSHNESDGKHRFSSLLKFTSLTIRYNMFFGCTNFRATRMSCLQQTMDCLKNQTWSSSKPRLDFKMTSEMIFSRFWSLHQLWVAWKYQTTSSWKTARSSKSTFDFRMQWNFFLLQFLFDKSEDQPGCAAHIMRHDRVWGEPKQSCSSFRETRSEVPFKIHDTTCVRVPSTMTVSSCMSSTRRKKKYKTETSEHLIRTNLIMNILCTRRHNHSAKNTNNNKTQLEVQQRSEEHFSLRWKQFFAAHDFLLLKNDRLYTAGGGGRYVRLSNNEINTMGWWCRLQNIKHTQTTRWAFLVFTNVTTTKDRTHNSISFQYCSSHQNRAITNHAEKRHRQVTCWYEEKTATTDYFNIVQLLVSTHTGSACTHWWLCYVFCRIHTHHCAN